MSKYKDFRVCQACTICVGSECSYEHELYRVGPYRLCGSCVRWLAGKGHIDPDTSRRSGRFTRLYPDGTTEAIETKLNEGEME